MPSSPNRNSHFVLRAPRNEPAMELARAKNGCASASTFSAAAPRATTSALGVNREIIFPPKKNSTTPNALIIITQPIMQILENRFAKSFRPAPRLWATSVVAAALKPKPGI